MLLRISLALGLASTCSPGQPAVPPEGGTTPEPESVDTDRDGRLDTADACPHEPEDIDNFEDEDGCPDLDHDRDGILDTNDRCPNEPEDPDGFEDEDGCPDRDNDNDGVLDAAPTEGTGYENLDRRQVGGIEIDCRDRAEDPDGVEDEDGCPEVLPLVNCRVVVRKKIVFRLNKWDVDSQSYPDLQEVVETLKLYPELKLEIQAHKDSTGANKYGMKPTQKRANSVRDYLVAQGIENRRLTAVGYGEDKPIASNRTAEGREKNRRVELVIQGCEPDR